MNSKTDFYNRYHKKNSDFAKVISENNATYYYFLPVISHALNYLIRSKTDKRLKALDVGCGVGTLAFYLAENGLLVDGVDVSSSAIEICQRFKQKSGLINTDFMRENVAKLKSAKKYDLILCTELIEHVEDDSALLKKLSLLLNKNGYLLISTPSKDAPLFKLGFLKKFDREVGHLRRYSKANIVRLISKNGFEIIEVKQVEGILRNSLFTFKPLGFFVKFLKGPITPLFHRIDMLSVSLFGESDLIILARKK